jgi:7-carboxy-7-deazaguanine synthase
MIVSEIFKSIQGESSFAGTPCSFVRTTGCNLRCFWCDTQYAFYGGKKMTVKEVLRAVSEHRCKLVEITGGEPLLQNDVPELAAELLKRDHTVLLETSGSQDISILPAGVIRIMDIKCPDSGMSEHMDWRNLKRLRKKDEIKFVIAGRKDYDWACEVMRKHRLTGRNLVLFSPVHRTLSPQQLAEWILQDSLLVRLQVQIQKILWGEERAR